MAAPLGCTTTGRPREDPDDAGVVHAGARDLDVHARDHVEVVLDRRERHQRRGGLPARAGVAGVQNFSRTPLPQKKTPSRRGSGRAALGVGGAVAVQHRLQGGQPHRDGGAGQQARSRVRRLDSGLCWSWSTPLAGQPAEAVRLDQPEQQRAEAVGAGDARWRAGASAPPPRRSPPARARSARGPAPGSSSTSGCSRSRAASSRGFWQRPRRRARR